MLMLRVLLEWMIQTYMLHIFDIVVLYDSIHLFTLMQNKTIIVSCVPNVALYISRVINLYYDIDCLIYPSIAWSSVLIKYNLVLIIN
jgi:hypothetical protein